jgi:hypothetical protein
VKTGLTSRELRQINYFRGIMALGLVGILVFILMSILILIKLYGLLH